MAKYIVVDPLTRAERLRIEAMLLACAMRGANAFADRDGYQNDAEAIERWLIEGNPEPLGGEITTSTAMHIQRDEEDWIPEGGEFAER